MEAGRNEIIQLDLRAPSPPPSHSSIDIMERDWFVKTIGAGENVNNDQLIEDVDSCITNRMAFPQIRLASSSPIHRHSIFPRRSMKDELRWLM